MSPHYIELFLLDENGKVIVSTNSEFVGLDKADLGVYHLCEDEAWELY